MNQLNKRVEKASGKNHRSGPFFLLDSHWHARAVRAVAGAMMIALYLWIVAGIVELCVQLSHAFGGAWQHAAEKMITHAVTLLAAFELIRTLQSYLKIGRVRVTLILDAALVVLIGELIGLWYGDYQALEVGISLAVIVFLALLRILTSRFSPGSLGS